MPTARAVPTPLTLVRVATGCVASSRSEPRQVVRISWPMPRAERPSDPLPRRIASSSLELKACAPWLRSRSRGLSAAGSSRIVSVTAVSVVVETDDRAGSRYEAYPWVARIIEEKQLRLQLAVLSVALRAAPTRAIRRIETRHRSRPCSRSHPRARPGHRRRPESPPKSDLPGECTGPPAET